MDPAVFGYIRVSQAEGESGLATQRRVLNDHGLRDDRIFTDVASGRNMRRHSWLELHGILRPGDTGCGPAHRPGGPKPLGGTQDHRGAPQSGNQHPLPGVGSGYRRRQPYVPSHAPHAALPGGVGAGHHPGPNQGRRGPCRGRGQDRRQAFGAVIGIKWRPSGAFLENGGSVSAAARTFGVSRPTVRAVRNRKCAGPA